MEEDESLRLRELKEELKELRELLERSERELKELREREKTLTELLVKALRFIELALPSPSNDYEKGKLKELRERLPIGIRVGE